MSLVSIKLGQILETEISLGKTKKQQNNQLFSIFFATLLRGSDESTYSTTSAASQEPAKEGKPEHSGHPSWNTGLLNPEAQEFIPKTTESTSPVGRKTGKKNKKKSPTHRCCQHCYKMGYDEAMYGSHSMRKKTKEIICPILLEKM